MKANTISFEWIGSMWHGRRYYSPKKELNEHEGTLGQKILPSKELGESTTQKSQLLWVNRWDNQGNAMSTSIQTPDAKFTKYTSPKRSTTTIQFWRHNSKNRSVGIMSRNKKINLLDGSVRSLDLARWRSSGIERRLKFILNQELFLLSAALSRRDFWAKKKNGAWLWSRDTNDVTSWAMPTTWFFYSQQLTLDFSFPFPMESFYLIVSLSGIQLGIFIT